MALVHLVRHGQASFGATDYDVLSPLGITQSELVGRALAARDLKPDLVVAGRLRRQQGTAESAVKAAGWKAGVRIDPAWDEFDISSVVTAMELVMTPPAAHDPRTYQEWFEKATTRWAGASSSDYAESFRDFSLRAEGALRALSHQTGSGDTTVVFTSGGVIAWIVTALLGGGVEQWQRLNRVAINTGITTVIFGRGGSTLVTYNEHGHLPRSLVTYR